MRILGDEHVCLLAQDDEGDTFFVKAADLGSVEHIVSAPGAALQQKKRKAGGGLSFAELEPKPASTLKNR